MSTPYWWQDTDTDSDGNNLNNWTANEDGTGANPAALDNTVDLYFSDTASGNNCSFTATTTVNNIYIASADTGGTDDYSGQLNLNDQNVTVEGNFKDSSTSIILGGTGTLEISGTVFTIAGTFTAETGTVKLSHSGASCAVNVGSNTFNDVEYDTDNDIAVTGTWDVNGNLTITALRRMTAGTITLAGNLITTETSTSSSGNGIVKLDGTSAQEVYVDKVSGTGIIPIGLTLSNITATITFYDTISINGALTVDASVTTDFTTNTTTIKFGGNSNKTWTLTSQPTFYNFEINADLRNFTVKTNDLIVSNTFTLTAIANINTSLGGNLELQGNVVLNDAAVAGTCTVTFTGSNAQTISGTGMKLPDGTVTVNKSGGSLTLGASLNLDGSGQDLVVAQGTFDTDIYDLTVNDTVTVSGGTLDEGSGDHTYGKLVMSSGAITGGSGSTTTTASSTTVVDFSGTGTYTHNSGLFKTTGNAVTLDFNTATLPDLSVIGDPSSTIGFSSDFTVNGNLFIQGVPTFGTATISLHGDYQQGNYGSINPTGNIVEFVGTGTQEMYTDKLGADRWCMNVKVNKASGTLYLFDVLRIQGNSTTSWSWTQGTVDAGTSEVIFAGFNPAINDSNSTFYKATVHVLSPTHKLTVTGSMNVSNTFKYAVGNGIQTGTVKCAGTVDLDGLNATSGNGTIELNGTGDQNIDIAAGSVDYGTMTFLVSNTAGIVKIAGATGNTFQTDTVTVNSNGTLCSNGNDITIDGTLTNNGLTRELTGDTITAGAVVGNAIQTGSPDCATSPSPSVDASLKNRLEERLAGRLNDRLVLR